MKSNESRQTILLKIILSLSFVVSVLFLTVSCSNTNDLFFSSPSELSAVELEGDFEDVAYINSFKAGYFIVFEEPEKHLGSRSKQIDTFDVDGNLIKQYPLDASVTLEHIALYSCNGQDSLFLLTDRIMDNGTIEFELYSFGLSTGELTSMMKFELSDLFPVSMAISSTNLYILGEDDRLVTIDRNDMIIDSRLMENDCQSIAVLSNRLLISIVEHDYQYLLLQSSENTDNFVKMDASYLAGNSFCIGDNSLYYCNTSGIYSTEPISGNTKKISDWQFMLGRISSNSVISVIPISERSIVLKVSDIATYNDASYYYYATIVDGNSDLSQKTITVAGFGISSDPTVLKALETFNANNTYYKAVIHDYYDGVESASDFDQAYDNAVRQMNLDILSGNTFDVFCGNIWEIEKYANNDVYEDLKSYIAYDTEFDSSLFLPNAINSCERDGRILYLFPSFSVSGLVGSSSVIGERSSWTINEFQETVDNQDSNILALPPIDYTTLLSVIVSPSLHDLITNNSDTVKISPKLFTEMLNFAKKYGMPLEQVADYPSSYTNDLLSKGLLMTGPCSIRGASYYMRTELAFDGPISITSYPSTEKTIPSFDASKCYAISSGSNYKAESWNFVKTTLSKEVQYFESTNDNIPVLISAFEDDILTAQIDSPNGTVPMSEQTAERYRSAILKLGGITVNDPRILSIIYEESMPYFYGDKNVNAVISTIESRLSVLLEE